jgi:hypothetical protein
MKNLFREIKWAYQRVARGYDDRIYWGFDDYMFTMFDPLKYFCRDYLSDDERCRLNHERAEVFKETLRLIGEAEDSDNVWEDKSHAACAYIGSHIGWYWD